MVRLKCFTAAFSFAVMMMSGLQKPLYAAEPAQAEIVRTDMQEYENTYEVYSAQQLAAALDGSCMDLSYRTMYERGRIHITMKNVSSDYAGTYALPSGIIVAKGKQFVLDMNGLDLYASNQDGQGISDNPVIIVPSSSSLTVQSSWIESSIRNISINNQGYLKLDGIHVLPAAGQAVYNTGNADLYSSDLSAGVNAVYAVINEGGTMTLDGEENAELAMSGGIYNIGNSRENACLTIKNGFHITGERAVVNNGGIVKVGALAERNTSVIHGVETGILTVNGGSTEMYDGTVQGGMAAVSTSPALLSSSVTGKTGGSFSMIGGTLSGSYGVAFQDDSYVSLKAGTVKGSKAAVASVAYDGTLTENITSYQFYNTDNKEADAYYYDESVKKNILCNEIYNGKIVSVSDESENGAVEEQQQEEPEELTLPMIEITVGGQDIYWNEAYENSAGEPDVPEEIPKPQFPTPVSVPDTPEISSDASKYYGWDTGGYRDESESHANQINTGAGIRDGTRIRDGTPKHGEFRIRDGTG